MDQGSDHELMMRVRDGRIGELGTLYERHHARLLSFLVGMTGDRAAAEDLVQEVFVRMLRYRESYRGEGHGFRTWMYTLARHAATDWLRRSARRRDDVAMPEAEPAGREPATDRTVASRQSLDALRRALLMLPPDKREVLLLRRFHFKRFDEIAAILDCPVGTAKVRAHRALRELRRIWEGLQSEATT